MSTIGPGTARLGAHDLGSGRWRRPAGQGRAVTHVLCDLGLARCRTRRDCNTRSAQRLSLTRIPQLVAWVTAVSVPSFSGMLGLSKSQWRLDWSSRLTASNSSVAALTISFFSFTAPAIVSCSAPTPVRRLTDMVSPDLVQAAEGRAALVRGLQPMECALPRRRCARRPVHHGRRHVGERAGADSHVVERQALGVLRRTREGTTKYEQAALPIMYS